MRYAAMFKPGDNESQYCVEFPDFEGCFTYGNSLAEAFHYAQEVLSLRIESLLSAGKLPPLPTRLEGENIYWIPLDADVVLKISLNTSLKEEVFHA